MAIVNALAYEYAFADLAARAHLGTGGTTLHVLYRSRGTGASAGTKKSMLRVLAAPALGYEEGKVRPLPTGAFTRDFPTDDGPRTGISFPGGEILTVPQHTPFRAVRTYVPVKPRFAPLVQPAHKAARVILRGPAMKAAEAVVDRLHEAPRNEGARGEIHLEAENTATRQVLIRTPDPYMATAHALAEGIARLVKSGRRGVLAPAEAFDAADFLRVLSKAMPDFTVRTRDVFSAE